MNERIEELAGQCIDPKWTVTGPMFDREKFSELIVRECKTALYKQYSNGEFMYLEGCYKAISDHLGSSGVEE
jgi:hypothetical protein